MGLYQFRLPDVGEGVAEAEITAWHIKLGDSVKEDQSLVDVMTDKATVDMTSPVDGIVTAIHGGVGSMMPVGSVLVDLEVADSPGDEAILACAAPRASLEVAATAGNSPREEQIGAGTEAFAPRDLGISTAPPASPSTRRRAKQLGIDLREIHSSGPAGRITSQDLDAHLGRREAQSGDPAKIARTGIHETRVIGLRRKIGEKMQDAKRRIPHIAYVEEFDVTELEALRQDLNEHRLAGQPKLTLLPFLIRALVRALPEFPQLNARYDDDEGVLRAHDAVHVGIATQTPGGLMVPVVRHAETLDVWALAAELSRLSSAARAGSARREELSGSTITITSLGALGGIATTPVINHPEVAIIGPNKIVERPVVNGHFMAVRKMMNVSSSFDHRIVDGFDAAQFIQRVRRMIEHPALIFIDANVA